MKAIFSVSCVLILSACATTPEQNSLAQYETCMERTLGFFGDFASMENRRKASESCQQFAKPAAPAQPASQP